MHAFGKGQGCAGGQVDLAQLQFPGHDHARPHHQARHNARHEQGRDGGVGGDAVNDERHARWNDRGNNPACGNQPGRGGHRVAVGSHHGQKNGGQRGRVGQCRAAHAGHQNGRADGDEPQAATDVADPGLGHGDDASTDAPRVHQFAGKYEKGHRQQRKAVHPCHQILRQQLRVPKIEHPGHRGAGEYQGKCHGRADAHEGEHADNENNSNQTLIHGGFLVFLGFSYSTSDDA